MKMRYWVGVCFAFHLLLISSGSMNSEHKHTRPDRTRVVMWRLGAMVAVPLALLLALEGALRLFGYGYSTEYFVEGLRDGHEVQLNNPKFGWRFFGPALARECWPFAFPAKKPPEVIRIFVLGESAAMGDPDPRFGLPRMLEAMLSQRFPGKRFEVVNTAVPAINSHVIRPIATECARQEADVWVIYMGNNEVEGPFGTGNVMGRPILPLASIRASLLFKRTRLGQWFDALLRGLRDETQAPEEWGGMEMLLDNKVRRDDPRLEQIYERFQKNLSSILNTGERSGAAIILSTVGVNLRDCGPFASLHDQNLAQVQLDVWEQRYQSGITLQNQGDPASALDHYRQAALIDAGYAELHFRTANCLDALGRLAEAGAHYRKALEADVLRFRADARLNEIARDQSGGRAKVRLFDAESTLAQHSTDGVPGGEFFYDHVHLTPSGNYLLARGIAGEVVAALGLRSDATGDAWPTESDCLQWLGLTGRNHVSLLTKILRRRASPPFSDQSNHEVEVRRLEMLLSSHRDAANPPAMARMAEELAALVSSRPGDADLRSNYASMLQATGGIAEAEREWREVIRLLPNAAQARIALGLLLERQGRPEEAAAQYRDCLKLSPKHPQARDRLASLSKPPLQ